MRFVQTPLSWRPAWLKKRETRSAASRGNIKALDGVRAIAALLVVSLHLNKGSGVPWDFNSEPLSTSFAVFGRTGVVLFFILSGFLLFRPYVQALLFQDEWPSIRTFYIRRIFRIWPAYYFTLFTMIILFQHQYLQPEHWKELALFLTFFMDSSIKTWQQLNGPFWTLAIEWQFYMVLPWLALGFAWIVRRVSSTPQQRLKATFACCGGLIVWGLAIRLFGHYYQVNPNLTILVPRPVLNFFLFFTYGIQGKYLEVFALGMIASTCYVYAHHPEFGPAFKERLERLSYWAWGLGILILACMSPWQAESTTAMNGVFSTVHSFPFLDQFQFQYMVFGDPITAAGYSLCMLAILFGPPALRWVFETRFLYLIGMVSFSLYMWHLKMLGIFQVSVLPYVPHLARRISYWLWVFLVIVPFCYVLYIFIERPGMRVGTLLTPRKSTEPQSFSAKLKTIFAISSSPR
ncbi:MAG TPA: acyltransferase [Ktedonobacteraceae bacterium]|nr:acyltransferase [Ktedonobacteraceae bacterium]